MFSYQLPSDLTRDQFHELVTDLYYRLTETGLDPCLNMAIGDHDEIADDGKPRSIFQVLISEDAAKILLNGSHPPLFS